MAAATVIQTVSGIVCPIAECSYPVIKRHLCYSFNYKTNIGKLENHVKMLEIARNDLLEFVAAEERKGKVRTAAANDWLSRADKAIEDAAKFLDDSEEQAKKRCLFGLIPNFKERHQLSKKADIASSTIAHVCEDCKLVRVACTPPPEPIPVQSVYEEEALQSRVEMLNQVMDALRDPEVNIVGVYGLPGVGKTTLAEEVRGQAMKEKDLFKFVVKVLVSQTPNLKEIQGKIGDALGLRFEEETVDGRAAKLHGRLMKEEKTLIILDDIWAKLKLEELGIPFGKNHRGHKVLLTSRFRNLLSKEMGAQRDFQLNVLQEEEARSLFKRIVGEFRDPERESLASEIARRCSYLPLLLVTMAKALQREDVRAWRDAWNRLSQIENEETEEVLFALELCYNQLRGEEVKSLFLLCGLLANVDIWIEDLLRCSVGLGLFKGTSSLTNARDRLHRLISVLKGASLLIDGDKDGYFRMHDVVRDTAIFIASRDHHAFACTGLEEWPNEDTFKDHTRMFLHNCHVQHLPEKLEHPELELLMVGSEWGSYFSISELFLEGITKLRVLHFTRLFSPLPHSFAFLKNLHSLCLHKCKVSDLAIIRELKTLEILSLRGSSMEWLPREIGQLTHLKLLDLSNCPKLKVIPANVISNLSLLEELYIGNSFKQWAVESKSNASICELELLSHLTTLEISVPDTNMLSKGFFCQKLESYKIFIGCDFPWEFCETPASSQLALKLTTNIHLENGYKKFMLTARDLYLDLGAVEGIGNVLYDLNLDGFPQLKHFRIYNGHDIIHIIHSTTNEVPCTVFPILESLHLQNLIKLEKICHGQLTIESFNRLRDLKINKCEGLKSLFSSSMVKCLLQLENMEIENCTNLEGIVVVESEENNEVLEFIQVHSLKLHNLPNLKGFCARLSTNLEFQGIRSSEDEISTSVSLFSGKVAFPSLEDIDIKGLNIKKIGHNLLVENSFCKLKMMIISGCQELQSVFPSNVLHEFRKLEALGLEKCHSLKEIYQLQENNVEITFELKRLCLCDLPKLKHIISNQEKRVFSCLEELLLDYRSMKIIFLTSTVLFSNVKDVVLHNIWGRFSLIIGFLQQLPSVKKLVLDYSSPKFEEHVSEHRNKKDSTSPLPQITYLNLDGVNGLKLCSQLHPLDLQYVDTLKISDCEDFIHIAPPSSASFQSLTTLEIEKCECNELITCSAAKQMIQLATLIISNCYNLKEIVAANDETTKAQSDEIITFTKLETLQLENLTRLTGFCLSSYTFRFPSLEQVTIINCPKMRIFSVGALSTPKLERLQVKEYGEKWRWHGNLNSTIEHMYIEEVRIAKVLKLSESPHLKEKWNTHQLPFNLLWHEIFELVVDECASISNAIPSNLLLFLNGLVTLVVEKCDSLEEVFDLKGLTACEGNAKLIRDSLLETLEEEKCSFEVLHDLELPNAYDETTPVLMPNLTRLHLIDLPKLRNVLNKDLRGILNFKYLSCLKVHYCCSLTSIFTSSVAMDLILLYSLEVKNCNSIKEIITKDEDQKKTFEGNTIFPSLHSIILWNLPQYVNFYLGEDVLNCPSLRRIDVVNCQKTEITVSTLSREGEAKNPNLVLLNGKVAFPNLDEWRVEWNIAMKLCDEDFEEQELFHSLKVIELIDFPGEYLCFPSDFFRRLPNLQKLVLGVDHDDFKPYYDELNYSKEAPAQVRIINIFELLNLKNLVEEDSQSLPIFQCLEVLRVYKCGGLKMKYLVPSSVSFQILTTLMVWQCDGITSVMTSSTAKSLVQLKTLYIGECKRMQEIVASEGDEVKDEICFTQLEDLEVDCLPCLKSFCSGNDYFIFPSLKRVTVIECPEMEIFTQGISNTPKLDEVETGRHHSDCAWEGNLNNTIKMLFEEMSVAI